MPWGTGTNRKNRLVSKLFTNSKVAKHSFVDAYIKYCPIPVWFNNSLQKVLPFLLEDCLVLSGRVRSRDKFP